jgi:hypothetical protein
MLHNISKVNIYLDVILLKKGVILMALKDTFKTMRDLLMNIMADLDKSENGNKAASQRVRTGTVRLEKVAKLYRKESISTEKKTKGQKKSAKPATSSATKGKAAQSAVKGKPSAQMAKTAKAPVAKSKAKPVKSEVVKAKPKAKTVQAPSRVKTRQMSAKQPTAKIATKKATR